jgi:hypothetical protein
MRLWRAFVMMIGLTLDALAVGAGASLAAVPTRDQAILNQRTLTATVKVRLLDTTRKTETNARGIRCAATTGQRGTTRDTTQAPTPNGGDQRIRQFDPGIQRAPETTSNPSNEPTRPPSANPGRNAQQRALMDGTSTVIGGVDTQAAIIPDTKAQYRQLTMGVGTAPTVKAALDQNSAVRIQNGLTWNQATQSANLLVQALNTANLFNVGQLSASAGGMATGLPPTSPNNPSGGGTCAAGLIGRGTADDPCRPATIACSTTPPGIAPDPNCVTPRIVDSTGNVATYLGGIQNSAQTAIPATPTAPPVTSFIQRQPAADLAAAFQPDQ